MTSPGLLSVLRALPGPKADLDLALAPLHPEKLILASARHGLAALLWHALEESKMSLPEPHHQTLRRHALASGAQTLKVKRLLLTSLDALATEGIVPVSLKGYGLGLRLYPAPLTRATTDVDLWVEGSAMKQAALALRGLGLNSTGVDHSLSDPQEHHQVFTGPPGMVELHFRLLSSYGRAVDDRPFWSGRTPGTLEGRPVYYLRSEDELVYLALHAMHHLLQRLTWIYDLKLFCLRHPKLDWKRVVHLAAETGFGSLVYQALEVARNQLDAPVPLELLSELAPGGLRQRVAQRLFTVENLEAAGLADSRPAWVSAKFLLSDDWRGLAKLGWHRLAGSVRGAFGSPSAST